MLFTQRVALYGADTSKWTAANLSTVNGAVAAFSVGGTGQFSDSDIGTLAAIGTGSSGFRSGSRISLDTGNAAGGTFTLNSTIANPNSNANVLNLGKTGTGTLELTGANTYSGQTFVVNGTLKFSTIGDWAASGAAASNLGAPTSAASGQINLANGNANTSITLLYVGAGSTTNRSLYYQYSAGGLGSGVTIDSAGTGPIVFTSGVTGNNAQTKPLNLMGSYTGAANEIQGVIASTAVSALNKSGAGTWKLSGTNTYTGATTINAGVLEVTTLANGGAASGIGQSGSAATSLVFGASSATLRYSGTANVTTDRGFTLSSGAGGGATIESSGAGTLSFDNTVAIAYGTTNQTRVLTLGGTNTGANTFSKILANNGTGTTSFVKAGTGSWVLGNANTYSGSTSISGGRLLVGPTGSINATNGISVSAGAAFDYNSATALTVAPSLLGSGSGSRATLGGTGTINASLTLNNLGDTLSPGNSPGIMPFGTSQTWNSFTYVWETNDFTGTTSGTAFDQIAITGLLNLTGGTGSYLLDITSLTAGNLAGDVPNFTETNRSWTILTTTGGISGFDAANWTLSTANFSSSPAAAGSWSLSQQGNNLVLDYVIAVPEPGTLALTGCGITVLALSYARRRRHSTRLTGTEP